MFQRIEIIMSLCSDCNTIKPEIINKKIKTYQEKENQPSKNSFQEIRKKKLEKEQLNLLNFPICYFTQIKQKKGDNKRAGIIELQ